MPADHVPEEKKGDQEEGCADGLKYGLEFIDEAQNVFLIFYGNIKK